MPISGHADPIRLLRAAAGLLLLAVVASLPTSVAGCVDDAAPPALAAPATVAGAEESRTPPASDRSESPPPASGDRDAGFGSSPVSAGPPQPAGEGDASAGSVPPLAEMPRSPAGLPMLPVVVKGERFLMELALDEPARRRGLGGRRSLARDRGMMFVHPRPEIQGYWMKDCFIDIDIVYVDVMGRVTATHRMKAEPPRRADESLAAYHRRLPSYSSRRPAALVLEFAPGTLDRLDLRMGETLDLDVTALRAISRE